MLRLILMVFAALVGLSAMRGFAQSAVAEPVADEKHAKEADAGVENSKESEAKKPESLYLRVQESDESKPRALQTAIVRYKGKADTPYAGKIVDLVGVVHIGQKEYYEDLNKRLSKYDAVLYELVAPDGTRIRPEDLQKRRSVIASMQSGMKDM
ncbi:MAG: hypothetical protein ACR2NZ_20195, partial [Rubripirellula sp.]